jgi:hypothetical protein
MSIRRDYILNQIDKLAQLIAAIISSKKVEIKEERSIDQSLAELTGLDSLMFSDPKNIQILGSLLSLLPDDNQKALAARLLELKNHKIYRDISHNLMIEVDQQRLHEKVKAIFKKTSD